MAYYLSSVKCNSLNPDVMKKIAFFSILAAILISGCRVKPEAGFTVSNLLVEAGEDVYFTNTSLDAVSYEWDFGDGFMSYERNPVYRFLSTGTFTVTLKAISKDNLTDRAFIDITVLPTTVLNILVLEYWDEYIITGAEVTLYSTYDDWLDFADPVISGFTNSVGEVEFYHVAEGNYYVDIYEDLHDNELLGLEDPLNVKIYVTPNELNLWTMYVDYYPPGKKSVVKGERKVRSVRIEPGQPREKMPVKREAQ